MIDEMLTLARRNAVGSGVENAVVVSVERLMTQLLTTTSTDASGSGIASDLAVVGPLAARSLLPAGEVMPGEGATAGESSSGPGGSCG